MVVSHSITYSAQLLLFPFTYLEERPRYKWMWKTYGKIWKYTLFVAGVGTIWVIAALAVAGWQDTLVHNHLSTLTGVTLLFYVIYESLSFWFVWVKMPFVLVWYEWNDFENDEYRRAFIDTIWGREEELEEDDYF